jgi:hypothetical protein
MMTFLRQLLYVLGLSMLITGGLTLMGLDPPTWLSFFIGFCLVGPLATIIDTLIMGSKDA